MQRLCLFKTMKSSVPFVGVPSTLSVDYKLKFLCVHGQNDQNHA